MSSPGPTPQNAADTSNHRVAFEPEREVRFAVVMYGGVSLAIYINGITQELLNMVRATAPGTAQGMPWLEWDQLEGTEKVYRKLAYHLDQCRGASESEEETNKQPRTRFVVDIISGTSAGGINGVFLAKALARKQKMDGLKELWLSEGDLSKLLNDTKAEDYACDTGFAVRPPESSLLNSQRMYCKLLEALKQMEVKDGVEKKPPNDQDENVRLADELDLFITTTDIEGIPLPIKLADRVIYERRYKNVFHFRYAPDPRTAEIRQNSKEDFGRDDFTSTNDPFLAFAARCTSSFPFAFEAMQLGDLPPILQYFPDQKYRNSIPKDDDARWDDFFKDYLLLGLYDIDKNARGLSTEGLQNDINTSTSGLRKAFRARSFGDGGYLDNKPFSYATSMLTRRQANCVVDRKLLYVEPTPEHPIFTTPGDRPDFAKNIHAAAVDLPRRETIRDDLERIQERNDLLERIAAFSKDVDEDVLQARDEGPPLSQEDFRKADLNDMIHRCGVNYGAYHRLKVDEITAMLTDLVARALGHDPNSDAVISIREVVERWRGKNYIVRRKIGDEQDRALPNAGNQTQDNSESKPDELKTENAFLLEFDIRYTRRRLSFLNRRINQLGTVVEKETLDLQQRKILTACLSHFAHVAKITRAKRPSKPTEKNEALGESTSNDQDLDDAYCSVDLEKLAALKQQIDPETAGINQENLSIQGDPRWLENFRCELNRIKRDMIAPALVEARLVEEAFLKPDASAAEDLRTAVHSLPCAWKDLHDVLSEQATIRENAIRKILEKDPFEPVAAVLRNKLSDRSFRSLCIARRDDRDFEVGASAARLCLHHYYRNFVLYDLVTYPIQYGTGAGESSPVAIHRVSPEDATSLINERAPGETRQKLAGRALMSFGAFLDRRWRKNDMRWGRLDGAERLITILLPGEDAATKKQREKFISDAQKAILQEDVVAEDITEIAHVFADAVNAADSNSEHLQSLRDFVQRLTEQKDWAAKMESVLRHCIEKSDDLLEYYRNNYEVDRRLDAENSLRLISRATTITGKMFQELARQHEADKAERATAWITRAGATFWNIIGVAVPRSLGNLFLNYWLGLAYLVAFGTLMVGVFLNERLKIAGWEMLGVVIATQILIAALGDLIAGGRRMVRAIIVGAVILVDALVLCGVAYLAEKFPKLNGTAEKNILVVTALLVLLGNVLPLCLKKRLKRDANSSPPGTPGPSIPPAPKATAATN